MIAEPRMNTDIRGLIQKQKEQPSRPACPPLHQPSVFPGYLIYIFNTRPSPEKIKKNFWNKLAPVPESRKEEHESWVYIVIAARTLLRVICWACSATRAKPAPIMYSRVSQTSRDPVPTTWPFSS